MRRFLLALVVCCGLVSVQATGYARAGIAPAFPSSLRWFNVSRPLTLGALKGRAVLLDFMTPGCINCIQMLAPGKVLHLEFGDRLVIIGVDSAKFTASTTPAGLRAFIQRYGVRNPMVLDAKLQLWNAYGAVAWPTLFLIGPGGKLRQRFVGERSAAELAGPIKAALRRAPPAADLASLPLQPEAMGQGILDAPAGIAVSPALVAIADTGHNRIVLANHAGVVKAVIGSGCIGHANGGYRQATFYRPHGLAFHDGDLYVADTGNQMLRRIDLSRHTVGTLAGVFDIRYVTHGSFPAVRAILNSPWGLAWYGGKLYVSMAGDHQIWRYDPDDKRIGPWAGTGSEGIADGSREGAEFAQPSGLSVQGNTLYDADAESSSVRAISLPRGTVRTLIGFASGRDHASAYSVASAGLGSANVGEGAAGNAHNLFRFGLRNGRACRALLQHDEAIVADGNYLYIAGTFNDAVRRLDLTTHQVTTVAALLQRPLAIAMLNPDTLLVAESTGNRVAAVHVPGGKVSPWPLSGLHAPTGGACFMH